MRFYSKYVTNNICWETTGRCFSRGFTLLFAALTSSLLMLIGFSVFRLTLKEVQLTSAAKDSQSAFYAADVGIECALYWDFQVARSAFDPTDTSTRTLECVGASKSITGNGGPSQTFSVWDFVPPTADYCLKLRVQKLPNPSPPPARLTIIQSRGYNTCDTTNPRRIERAIDVRYRN